MLLCFMSFSIVLDWLIGWSLVSQSVGRSVGRSVDWLFVIFLFVNDIYFFFICGPMRTDGPIRPSSVESHRSLIRVGWGFLVFASFFLLQIWFCFKCIIESPSRGVGKQKKKNTKWSGSTETQHESRSGRVFDCSLKNTKQIIMIKKREGERGNKWGTQNEEWAGQHKRVEKNSTKKARNRVRVECCT